MGRWHEKFYVLNISIISSLSLSSPLYRGRETRKKKKRKKTLVFISLQQLHFVVLHFNRSHLRHWGLIMVFSLSPNTKLVSIFTNKPKVNSFSTSKLLIDKIWWKEGNPDEKLEIVVQGRRFDFLSKTTPITTYWWRKPEKPKRVVSKEKKWWGRDRKVQSMKQRH